MFMACGFRKALNILLILVMMIFTGCGNVEEISPESIEEEITTEITEEVTTEIVEEITTEISEAGNMDKVSFFATISHNHQAEKYTDTDVYYYFVVQNDGTVWTMDNNYMEDNYEWRKKFVQHDESAWETADHLENIGSLSPEETKLLAEYISGINYDSEDYDRLRDDGAEPEVIETIYYNYYCVIPDNKSKWFSIMYTGEQQGVSYHTYDENALSAVKLIQGSQLYNEWRNKVNRT